MVEVLEGCVINLHLDLKLLSKYEFLAQFIPDYILVFSAYFEPSHFFCCPNRGSRGWQAGSVCAVVVSVCLYVCVCVCFCTVESFSTHYFSFNLVYVCL